MSVGLRGGEAMLKPGVACTNLMGGMMSSSEGEAMVLLRSQSKLWWMSMARDMTLVLMLVPVLSPSSHIELALVSISFPPGSYTRWRTSLMLSLGIEQVTWKFLMKLRGRDPELARMRKMKMGEAKVDVLASTLERDLRWRQDKGGMQRWQ